MTTIVRFKREGDTFVLTIDGNGPSVSVPVSTVNAIFLAQEVVTAVTGAMLNNEVGKPKFSTNLSTNLPADQLSGGRSGRI